MKRIDIVDSGDYWVALYVDGQLYYEGHSITERVWLELLGKFGVTFGGYVTKTEKWWDTPHTSIDIGSQE